MTTPANTLTQSSTYLGECEANDLIALSRTREDYTPASLSLSRLFSTHLPSLTLFSFYHLLTHLSSSYRLQASTWQTKPPTKVCFGAQKHDFDTVY